MTEMKSILVLGNPVDGFTFFGPFENTEAAVDHGNTRIRTTNWWAANLIEPPKPKPKVEPKSPAERMKSQSNEFLALHRLAAVFDALPPGVDDYYPMGLSAYERELQAFIEALRANGRI